MKIYKIIMKQLNKTKITNKKNVIPYNQTLQEENF